MGQLATDPLEAQAHYFIHYYQSLAESEGDSWLMGLYMAQQWLRYLKEPQVDLGEVRLFKRALEAERKNQGSGWTDLLWRVRNWINNLEVPGKAS